MLCGGKFQITSSDVQTNKRTSCRIWNMATSSASSRGTSRGNFYSASNISRTPSPPSARGRNSRTSPDVLRSTSSSSSAASLSSTPISSRDSISTLQQVIAGLPACQTSIQDLLKTVDSSNERIKDLSEKMKTLDDKVDKLSSDQVVDADRSGNDTRGVKRKRTKASLLIQVRFNAYLCRTLLATQSTRFIAYNSVGWKYTYAAALWSKIGSNAASIDSADYDTLDGTH